MRDFKLIENKNNTEFDEKLEQKPIHQTNPIAKKFIKFHQNHKFSVKNLFK